MSRAIEFRAWNPETKQMTEPSVLVLPYPMLLPPKECAEFWISSGTVSKVEIVLLQFTGLLDLNGKKIFEGDIVRREICLKDDPAHVGFYGIDYVVKWCDQEAGFNLYEVDTGNFQFGAVNFDVKIIGNIYENEDLLT